MSEDINKMKHGRRISNSSDDHSNDDDSYIPKRCRNSYNILSSNHSSNEEMDSTTTLESWSNNKLETGSTLRSSKHSRSNLCGFFGKDIIEINKNETHSNEANRQHNRQHGQVQIKNSSTNDRNNDEDDGWGFYIVL